MTELYSYLVAAHVTAVIFFVGSMIAYNRMLVVLSRNSGGNEAASLVSLYDFCKKVATPALLFTWLFGMGIAVWAEWFPSFWLIIKLVFVVALSALHGVQSGRLRRALRDGVPPRVIPGAAYGIALMSTFAVFLAVVKPFT